MSAEANTFDVTIRTDVLSNRLEESYFIDTASFDAAFAALEAHFNIASSDLDPLGSALQSDPTSIAATSILWGSLTDGLRLTGPGLNEVSDINQLRSQLDDGIASGAFDTLDIFVDGSTLLSVSFAEDAYTLSAAGQTLTVSGALPDTLQDMFDFLQAFTVLVDATDPADPILPGIATFMDQYSLSSLTHNDGTDDQIDISVGGTGVTVEIAGATLQLDGTFPLSTLGDLIDFYVSYGDSDISDLSQIPELGLTGLTVTDRNDNVQLQVTGTVTDLEETRIATVTVNGTDDRDRGIELPIFVADAADVVNINMLGGYDLLEFDAAEMIFQGPIAETNISMGDDSGSLLIETDYFQFEYVVDFELGVVTAFWDEYRDLFEDGVYVGSTNVAVSGSLNMLDEFRLEVGANESFYFYQGVSSPETTVLGSDDNDRVVAVTSGNEIQFFGEDGTDIIELHRTKLNPNDDGGITLEEFQQRVNVYLEGDNVFFNIDDGANGPRLSMLLNAVEEMRFMDGDDDVEVSLQEVAAGIDITLGTTGDDIIEGEGDLGEIFASAQGDDEVYAEGYLSRFAGDVGGQVYRLYQATLDRAPDAGGYGGWIEVLTEGTQELVDVARGFVNSGEFQSVYGALTDSEFIELLYQNVLGRDADAGGLNGWLDAMSNGLAREGVVVGFSQSGEFRNNTAADAATYAEGTDPASWSDEVYRIYRATFDRDPDTAGFEGWTSLLANGRTLDEAIAGFTRGAEFTNTYGADLTDTDFVDLLYQNVLGRSADTDGLQGWLDAMDGGLSREGVVKGFSESGEFRNNTADDLASWMRANMQDDQIVVGSGTNVVSGGFGADSFQFNASIDSQTTILDVEAWDDVRILEAGTTASIEGRLTQSGDDVVFEQGDFSITFADTTLDLVANGIITGTDILG